MDNVLIDRSASIENGEDVYCFGRDDEIRQVIATLLRIHKNFPVLVGEPGVGKTTIVDGVAFWLTHYDSAKDLKGFRVYELPYDCVAHMSSEELAQVAEKVIAFLVAHPKSILFLDEIQAFFRHNSVFGNLLKTPISQGKIKVIGATTPDEFAFIQRQDPAFARRINPIIVREMTEEQTKTLLLNIRSRLERHHDVRITNEALQAAVDLGKRLPNLRYPDKAIDLLDSASAHARVDDAIEYSGFRYSLTSDSTKPIVIGEREVQRAFAVRFGDSNHDIKASASNLAQRLLTDVVGQDEGIKKIANLIADRISYHPNPNRPLASFIFVGDSGVGKTWTANLIAKHLFGSEERLTTVNLGTIGFTPTHLLGSPPGYIGSDREPPLAAAIKTTPSRVIVFNDLDSARQWGNTTILRNILSNGVIHDNHGYPLDFRQAIIVIIVHHKLQSDSAQDSDKRVRDAIASLIGNDIVELVDDIIVFNPLNPEHLRTLAMQRIKQFGAFLEQKHGVALQLNSTVVDEIVESAIETSKAATVANLVEKKVTIPALNIINDCRSQGRPLPSPLMITNQETNHTSHPVASDINPPRFQSYRF